LHKSLKAFDLLVFSSKFVTIVISCYSSELFVVIKPGIALAIQVSMETWLGSHPLQIRIMQQRKRKVILYFIIAFTIFFGPFLLINWFWAEEFRFVLSIALQLWPWSINFKLSWLVAFKLLETISLLRLVRRSFLVKIVGGSQMVTFLSIVHIIVAILLIVVVLLQDSKGAGIGGAFGGGNANSVLGATGAANLLVKVTRGAVVIFAITAILLSREYTATSESALDKVGATPSERESPSKLAQPPAANPAAGTANTTAAPGASTPAAAAPANNSAAPAAPATSK
jgi:preprotein translocase subunit SecG